MVTEFRKEAELLMRSIGQWEEGSGLNFSSEPSDEKNRIVYDPSEMPETLKKTLSEV